MSQSCIFCRIVEGDLPAEIYYSDEQVIAFKDINPLAPVHILIVPRKHLPNLTELGEGDEAVIGHLHRVAVELARQHGVAEGGFRLVCNNGRDAGQVVFHLHFHLLGGRTMGGKLG